MLFENNDRIVFAGDSVTDMGSVLPVGEGLFDNAGHGYVRMFENLITALYPQLNVRVTNSGVSGNTSRDLLERYERDVVALKPDWVSILIGINDVWRQFDSPAMKDMQVMPDEYRQNVETMLCSVKDKVKGIWILTPYYMEPNKDDPMRKRMDEYGEICKVLAEKYHCTLIDMQKMYDDYFAYQHSSRIAWDRVHPNEIGATRMALEIFKALGIEIHL